MPLSGTSTESPGGGKGIRLVAVGGGTGLSSLLRGLKQLVGNGIADLSAVVTVSDDGGSSGRLRRDLEVPPPGDIRNCLVALADDEDLLARLFQYRFPGGQGLTGHSFGNLFLTALTGITGDFYQAVVAAEQIFSARGRILPATLADVRLRGVGTSGRVYDGESAVGTAGEPLERLELIPAAPPPFPAAVEALRRADLIVLGPGSLYTSLVANLLIPGIREAVENRRGRMVLPLNLMTQPGETDGLDGPGHLEMLQRQVGAHLVDVVLVSSTPLPPEQVSRYALLGARPIHLDAVQAAAAGVELKSADLLAGGGYLRHDPSKLARALLSLAPRPAATGTATGTGAVG